MATHITMIIGQLVIGIVIDNLGWFNSLVIHLDIKRYSALLFMIVAFYLIYKENKHPSEEISA
ncbi:DMT family transporter [Priestia endophytica]|uniref:DMT family transporter n=1 Tax=Priestia endophytica TaxID=135735 RepID=UPI00389AE630